MIATDRLLLAALDSSDAPELFDYRSDEAVCRYQTFLPESLQDAVAFIESSNEHPFGTPGSWCQLGIRLIESRKLIGDLGICVQGHDVEQAEIGVTLSPEHQGQGYAAEALKGLLTHLFDQMSLHRVFASVDPRNEAAMALLSKLGMRQEALFKKSYKFRGAWVDDAVFGLLAADWHDPTRSP